MNETIGKYAVPAAFLVGGFLFGLIFERIVLPKLKKATDKTKWHGDEIIVNSLRGMFLLWFILAGIYGAIASTSVKPSLLSFFQKAILAAFVFSATLVVARLAVSFVQLYSEKVEGLIASTSIFANLTRLVVFVFGALIILQTLNISITPVLTALGVGGLAVALALQDTLSNLFAGLNIVASKQVKKGDYIKLESGEEGYVIDITWRNTTIRALPNNVVVIPNSKLASAKLTNYYMPEKEMSVLVQVGVSYDSDLEKVEKITIEVAKETLKEVKGGVAEFEPFIRYHTFSDFSIQFTVILRAKEFVDQYLLKHEFVKKLHQRYKKEKIEIPFPIRTVYMKSE
ncbi:MAG: mechanosensitive ion channel family protein [Planctomycetota bacterium]